MIISSRNVCTLICLGCAQLLLAPPCHMCELSLSTCNRSLNIFALFPFGFCKTSALQSCRNFPYTTAPCNPTTCYISCSCSWSIFATEVAPGNGSRKKRKKSNGEKQHRHRAADSQCHCEPPPPPTKARPSEAVGLSLHPK